MNLRAMEDLFQGLTAQMLGYSGEQDRVRISWPTRGQPDWNVDEDICFLRITASDDSYNRQRDVSYRNGEPNLRRIDQYTRVISVFFIFYGPNSFDRAEDVRYKILLPEWKLQLAQSRFYPIPDIPSPMRSPELFQSQWWERSDLVIRFNEFVTKETEIPAIEGVEIIINQENGRERIISGNLEP